VTPSPLSTSSVHSPPQSILAVFIDRTTRRGQ
jgi:hypothetical protein